MTCYIHIEGDQESIEVLGSSSIEKPGALEPTIKLETEKIDENDVKFDSMYQGDKDISDLDKIDESVEPVSVGLKEMDWVVAEDENALNDLSMEVEELQEVKTEETVRDFEKLRTGEDDGWIKLVVDKTENEDIDMLRMRSLFNKSDKSDGTDDDGEDGGNLES